jgi:hypothetical protein
MSNSRCVGERDLLRIELAGNRSSVVSAYRQTHGLAQAAEYLNQRVDRELCGLAVHDMLENTGVVDR